MSTRGMAPEVRRFVAPVPVDPDQPVYLRSWDRVSPVGLAARVRPGTRVLITEGSRDLNVPPATVGPLVGALRSAGTTGPGLDLVEGTDHFMHTADQPDTEAVLAPAIVTAVQRWAAPYAVR